MVPQKTEFFKDRSIAENIGYANLSASRSEIEKVCQKAHIHDAIMKRPGGYNEKLVM